jgi:flagellar protein FliJ
MDAQFKLEALRRYRGFQEETRQKEMAEAQRIRDQEAAMLATLISARDKTEKDMQSKQQARTTGPHMTIYHNYLDKLASDIFAQKFKLADAENKLADKRKALLAAMQKRKALDKLKEKWVKAKADDLSQAEQKFINEMAISRYSMKQK